MISVEYLRAAHKRAILQELIRVLRADYSAESGEQPKKKIVCERVFIEDRDVSEESIESIIEELLSAQKKIEELLEQFEFRRRDEQAPAQVGKSDTPPQRKRGGAPPQSAKGRSSAGRGPARKGRRS